MVLSLLRAQAHLKGAACPQPPVIAATLECSPVLPDYSREIEIQMVTLLFIFNQIIRVIIETKKKKRRRNLNITSIKHRSNKTCLQAKSDPSCIGIKALLSAVNFMRPCFSCSQLCYQSLAHAWNIADTQQCWLDGRMDGWMDTRMQGWLDR